MLRAVGALLRRMCFLAALALPASREFARRTELPALVLRLDALFAAGFLTAAAAPALGLFVAAAFVAVGPPLAASAVPVLAAIRTAAQSSRPRNAIARTLALFSNNLTPKATPILHRPNRP
jgi:hypothetical protein